MRLLRYINEKYAFTTKPSMIFKRSVPIFVNPSRKEIREIISSSEGNTVRFSAFHHEQKVFMWDANLIIHDPVESEIFRKYNLAGLPYTKNPNLFAGLANMSGGKLVAYSSDQLRKSEVEEKILSKDWSWLEKYVSVKKYLDRFR